MLKLTLLCLLLLGSALPADAATAMTHHSAKKNAAAAPAVVPQLIPLVPPIVLTYDIYLGGFHFISADLEFQEQTGTYHSLVLAHTVGFWYRFFPWDSELVADGDIVGDRFVPREFMTHDVWSHKVKTTKIHFAANGATTTEFQPASTDDSHEAITDEQKRGSMDPVSGLLQLLAHVAVAQNCDVSVPIYDGKLLFSISGNDVGTEDIDDDDYNIYKGPSRTCDANFALIAGEWKNKVKSRFWYKSETERGRDPFHIWLARLRPDLPELPVRMESKSVWGNVVLHLSKWRTVTPGEVTPIVVPENKFAN